MAIPWKLYLTCWFLGASVQSTVFFSFNAVDYFNYFFPDNYKPEVYVGVTVGVGASVGAVLMVTFPPKSSHLTVLLLTLAASVILLVAEVVITPLDTGILSTQARFGSVLTVIFVATVVQNVGGGALYSWKAFSEVRSSRSTVWRCLRICSDFHHSLYLEGIVSTSQRQG